MKSSNQLKSTRITFRREDKTEIKNLDHFQTLEYLNIRDGALLFFENTEVMVANIIILNPEKTDFTGVVISAWKRLFAKFSANGVMTPELFARFTVIATDGHPCSPDEPRVRGVFQRFGVSQTSMDETGFIDFYRDSATKDEKSETIVKQNLLCFEYDGRGKFKWEQEEHPGEILGGLTRVKLANDPDTFLQLIKLLSEDTITPTTLLTNYDFIKRLFSMLPPPTKLLKDALTDPSQFVAVSKTPLSSSRSQNHQRTSSAAGTGQVCPKYLGAIGDRRAGSLLSQNFKRVVFGGLRPENTRIFGENTQLHWPPGVFDDVVVPGQILKGMVSLQSPDFLAIVKKMSNHFVGRQKKSAEKALKKPKPTCRTPIWRAFRNRRRRPPLRKKLKRPCSK